MTAPVLKTYQLSRVYLPTESIGSIYSPQGGLVCKTMELPWRDNKRGISCIPEGLYYVVKKPPIERDDPQTPEDESGGRHPRPYWHFRLPKVKGRSGILIHRITYVKDLQGCIGVGVKHVDLNKDGVPDMIESGKALQELVDTLPDEFNLLIDSKSQTPYK